MLHPVEKIYETDATVSRVTMGLIYLRSPVAGKIKRFALWFTGGSGVGVWKFDVRVAGVSQFPDFADMITLNSSNSFYDEIGSLNVTVAEGTIILLDLRSITGGPIVAPGTFFMEVDDEVAYITGATLSTDGTLASNSDAKVPTEKAVKTYADGLGGGGSGVVETIVAGTNITVDDTDPANPIVAATGGGGSVGLFSPDIPYASPSTEDDEFDGPTLAGKWTSIYTAGGQPYVDFALPGHLKFFGSGNTTFFQCIYQTIPAGAVTFGIKIIPSHHATGPVCGLIFRFPTTSGDRNHEVFYIDPTSFVVTSYTTSDESTASGNVSTTIASGMQEIGAIYLKGEYDPTADTLKWYWSWDGIQWQYHIGTPITPTGAVDAVEVGIIAMKGSTTANFSFVDWFRKLQGSYFGGTY